MAAFQKAMDTQIAQIAQQVSHLSRPQGHLPGQVETNPRGHVNVVSTVEDGLEESPVMVVQETVSAPVSVGLKGSRVRGGRPLVRWRVLHLPFVLISREYHTLRGWLGPSYFSLSPSMLDFWRC